MSLIDLRKETQLNPVADEVSALLAVVRPILTGGVRQKTWTG